LLLSVSLQNNKPCPMYSITAALLLSPCLANRIQRDVEADTMKVEVATSVEVETSHEVDVGEPLQTLSSLPPGTGEPVDWHFMTQQFSWAGRGDQRGYDTVQGHVCQSGGSYDESYSASSLCYWRPDAGSTQQTHWGLNWRGGYGPREFCRGLNVEPGVCARCVVCHDNSRDRDAQVDVGFTRAEIIPLPECMKESAIEAECEAHFASANSQLVNEEAQCRDSQTRYEEAVANWLVINNTIASSESSLTGLIHTIAFGQPLLDHCGAQTIQDLKRHTVRQCRRFGARNAQEIAEILTSRPSCEVPPMYVKSPICAEGTLVTDRDECRQALSGLNLPLPRSLEPTPPGFPPPMWRNCESGGDLSSICRVPTPTENNQTHQRCQRCNNHMDTLQNAVIEGVTAQDALVQWQAALQVHQQSVNSHRQILAQSYQSFGPASHLRAAMEAEWLPRDQHCHDVYRTVVSARNANMQACAPHYYDQSCEKACVEIQRSGEHGCGVVEGSQYGDAFERGGVEVTCSPPFPSWIKSPSNYGGSAQVNSAEQCGRINAEQRARATTPPMLSMWLTRPGTGWFSGDRRRFYVLESGNGVRTAVLRSFNGALPDGSEETNDSINMWDAEEVKATETTRERACFEIKHRYEGRSSRWQRRGETETICVMRDDDTSGDMGRTRDQWVSTLQGLLVWRPRVA